MRRRECVLEIHWKKIYIYFTYIYNTYCKIHKAIFFLQVAFKAGSSVTFSFVNDNKIYVVSYVIFYSTQKCTGLPGYMGWRAGTTTLCRRPELTLFPSHGSMSSATELLYLHNNDTFIHRQYTAEVKNSNEKSYLSKVTRFSNSARIIKKFCFNLF